MGPTFFGSSKEPLFGFYHRPRGARTRELGILMCAPSPQEYMRTHWAYRRLAETLSKRGFPVFRFDYYGTGDSAGATDAGSLQLWRENIDTAARELRDASAARKLAAIGFRLGALLAATCGTSFEELVLWEPVISGSRFMKELEAIQLDYLARNISPPWSPHKRPEQLLGFPLSRAFEAQLRALDLLAEPLPKAQRASIFVSEPSERAEQLAESWSSRKLPTEIHVIPEEVSPGSTEFQAALLSNNMLQAIATHFD